MFELWARKRPIDGRGFPYEFIASFEEEYQKYSMMDRLDRNIYQEAMVSNDNGSCIMYREFEKPNRLIKRPNEGKK